MTKPINVIGMGSAGIDVIERMENRIDSIEFVAVDSDSIRLSKCNVTKKVLIPPSSFLSEDANHSLLQNAIGGAGVLFIITSVVDSGFAHGPAVARLGAQRGALIISLVIPHESEEDTRATANEELKISLRSISDVFIEIPSGLYVRDGPRGSFAKSRGYHGLIERAVGDLSSCLANPAMQDKAISFLRFAGLSHIGIGTARGIGRVREATIRAVSMLREVAAPNEARRVFYTISGKLDYTEMNQAAPYIKDTLNPDSVVLYGGLTVAHHPDEVRVTALFSGYAFPNQSRETTIEHTAETTESRSSKGESDPYGTDRIWIVWDPEVVDSEHYAALVRALGDLVRLEGGVGVRRVDSTSVDLGVPKGALV